MKAELVFPQSDVWATLLTETSHDVFHTPGYTTVLANHEGGLPRAFLASDGYSTLLIPIILRPIPEQGGDLLDAISPYGYPGPLLHHRKDGSDGFLSRAISELPRVLQQHRVVSLFMRCHPLMSIRLDPFDSVGSIVRHGETVYMDLTQSNDQIWRQIRSGHRNEINRAKRNGQSVSIDHDHYRLGEFMDIYMETMDRLGASTYYRFAPEFFNGLIAELGEQLAIAFVELDGVPIAAGMFTECCGTVQYFLSGARAEYQKQQPTKLMLYEMAMWAKARNNHTLHLGGGLGGAKDSLFAFKSGFAKTTRPFYTWRLIAMQNEYDYLVRRRGLDISKSDYFPAYRQPIK